MNLKTIKTSTYALFLVLIIFVCYGISNNSISIDIPATGKTEPTPTPTTSPFPTSTPSPTPTPTPSPTSNPYPTPSPVIGNKLLAISDKTYLGAWFQASNAEQLWTSNFGKGIAIGWYMSFMGPPSGTPMPYWHAVKVLQDVAIPAITAGKYDAFCLTWQPQYSDTDNTNTVCIGEIANGQYDTYIRSVAKWIKLNFHYPLIIRFAHEMNIDAWGWGADPSIYKQAWIRTVNIFNEESCYVSWFWCPSYSLNNRPRAENYYPDDAYVDWIGVDMYSNTFYGPQDPVSQLTSYDQVWQFSLTHNKPFMVGEWGLNIGGGVSDSASATWVSQLMDFANSHSTFNAMIHWGGWSQNIVLTDGSGNLVYPLSVQAFKNKISANPSRYLDTLSQTSPIGDVMLGAWLGENAISPTQLQTAIPSWELSSGKGLAWYAIMSNFGASSSTIPMTAIDQYGPLVQQGLFDGVIYTWQPSYDWNWDVGGVCTAQIASGAYDTYIQQEAQRCKTAGYPIIIRWGHEMNTYWAGWGNNPDNYKQAWIRIVNIFRSVNVPNVKFFWCPNYNDNPWDGSRNFELYYPSDSYVDYVGIDIYANNDWGWWSSAEIQIGNNGGRSVYNTYTNKPYIIGEWGCSNSITDSQNADWVSSMFNAVESRSRIVMIVHWRGIQDGWSVELHPQAFTVYKQRSLSDYYTSQII